MLVEKKITEFMDELSSNSPAPGGGSVSALCGALAASLECMVCNLTIGKEKYAAVEEEMVAIRKDAEALKTALLKLIDEDTKAFNGVMEAFKMPKETEEQKQERRTAIQQAYKGAASVPLKTADTCYNVLKLTKRIAEVGNPNSITDVGVAALCAHTGLRGAILNVKINLSGIKDEEFNNSALSKIEEWENKSEDILREAMSIVYSKI